MNSELIALTFKGLCRRWREVVRVVAVVMISFMFVTGVLLYSGNMKKWQTAINKQHFGNWFVMFYNSTNKSENDVIKNHPYLEQAVTAVTVRSISPLAANLIAVVGDAINFVAELLKALWDNLLLPVANWLLTTFGPTITTVCTAVSGIVTNTIGVIADVLNIGLLALKGVIDFMQIGRAHV